MDSAIDLVVDTSAALAILSGEPEARALLTRLKAARSTGMAAASRTELLLVMHARFGAVGVDRAKQFLAQEQIKTIPVDEPLADAAVLAYQRFGKGRHPASLNFGDCFSYAAAHRFGVALLFKGTDFSQTDLLDA